MQEIEYAAIILPSKASEVEKFWDSLSKQMEDYQKELVKITGKEPVFYDVKFAFRSSENSPICLAVDKNKNVYGFILIEIDFITKTLWTSHVYVNPDFRKQGVYSRMMDRVKKFAKDTEMRRIFSLVYTKNVASMAAHAKQEFKYEWSGFEMEVK